MTAATAVRNNQKDWIACEDHLWLECIRTTVKFLNCFIKNLQVQASSVAMSKFSQNYDFQNLLNTHGITKILNAVIEQASPEKYVHAKRNLTLWKGLVPSTYFTANAKLFYADVAMYANTFDDKLKATEKQRYVKVLAPTVDERDQKQFGSMKVSYRIEFLTQLLKYKELLLAKRPFGIIALDFLCANKPPEFFGTDRIFMETVFDEVYPDWESEITAVTGPAQRSALRGALLGYKLERFFELVEAYIAKHTQEENAASSEKEPSMSTQSEPNSSEQAPGTEQSFAQKEVPNFTNFVGNHVTNLVKFRRLTETTNVLANVLSAAKTQDEQMRGGEWSSLSILSRTPHTHTQGFGSAVYPRPLNFTTEQIDKADSLIMDAINTLFPDGIPFR